MKELSKNIQAASFNNGVKRYNQTALIVKMISDKIKEGTQIRRQDIVECYLENFFPGGKGVKLGWNGDGWRTQYCTKEIYIKYGVQNQLESKALNWFMTNLGAAIIKGRLLVIPIIDIEPLEISDVPVTSLH